MEKNGVYWCGHRLAIGENILQRLWAVKKNFCEFWYSVQPIKTTIVCRRYQACDISSWFLATTEYAGDAALTKLFSCKECEKVQPDERVVMKEVVMDSTATHFDY